MLGCHFYDSKKIHFVTEFLNLKTEEFEFSKTVKIGSKFETKSLLTSLVKLTKPYALKNALKQPIIYKMSFHFPGRKQSCNRLYCIKIYESRENKKNIKNAYGACGDI